MGTKNALVNRAQHAGAESLIYLSLAFSLQLTLPDKCSYPNMKCLGSSHTYLSLVLCLSTSHWTSLLTHFVSITLLSAYSWRFHQLTQPLLPKSSSLLLLIQGRQGSPSFLRIHLLSVSLVPGRFIYFPYSDSWQLYKIASNSFCLAQKPHQRSLGEGIWDSFSDWEQRAWPMQNTEGQYFIYVPHLLLKDNVAYTFKSPRSI